LVRHVYRTLSKTRATFGLEVPNAALRRSVWGSQSLARVTEITGLRLTL
jgi:hypothetical protein